MSELSEGRYRILEYLTSQMLGPMAGHTESIKVDPMWQYTCGILYPPSAPREKLSETDFDTEDESFNASDREVVAEDDELGKDDSILVENLMMPSSFGLTFATTSEKLRVKVGAGSYKKHGVQRNASWIRTQLPDEEIFVDPSIKSAKVFGGEAEIICRWRSSRNGVRTLTIAISKSSSGPIKEKTSRVEADECLFQVSLEINCIDGKFVETPPRPGIAGGIDEEKFELLYKDRKTFARGHACAASWEFESEEVVSVFANHIPFREVFPTIPLSSEDKACSIAGLAFESDATIQRLEDFVNDYALWIDEVNEEILSLDLRFERAAIAISVDLARALERMNQGLSLLRNQPEVLQTFTFANRVMLHQMAQSFAAANGKSVNFNDPELQFSAYSWRPFQLAFALVVLPSLVDPHHPDRNIVDLIWFQTGGGKTEAYLLISAIEILWRRLNSESGKCGTVVLMRYTLRLLTAQQFERVSRMICALEILRIENLGLFPGSDRFSAGLWVGGDVTPNTFGQVDKRLESEDLDGVFGIRRCPWCSEIFDGINSFSRNNQKFIIRCCNASCFFSGENTVPIDVVDQSMYLNPPTLVVATVDKFAQMAWKTEVKAFLVGVEAPPSLIIQDELHLLGGALGSVYGLYEAAIDVLTATGGTMPKIIASTATIRDADKQVKALYGREVEVFPPSGISIDDSYFAKTTKEGSRLYVGLLSANKTATTSMIRTSSVLAQSPIELKSQLTPEEMDAYWTQVIYHTSLKEEGRTFSFLGDDIPVRIGEIATDKNQIRELGSDVIEELTSAVDSRRIPQILDRLSVSFGRQGDEPLSAVTCTNMLSVGVDVPRLGLIVVHGQPKSTSEYIQATSRIGRKLSHPGLVIAHYRTLNPRDLSHFELFTSYHDAFYRFVEPASVTPNSLPCRQRALHAGLVSTIRQGMDGKYSNNARVDFSTSEVQQIVAKFKSRVVARAEDSRTIEDIGHHIDRLVAEWDDRSKAESNLVYERNVNSESPLMVKFDDVGRNGLKNPWRTLTSMRSVDVDVHVKVEGRK